MNPLDHLGITARIADAVRHHERVALLYSGGIESSLLLRLAEPWRSRVTVYTVRTGTEFPHMVAFIDRKLEGWDHHVIPVDLVASFDQLGLPASVVPIEHVQGLAETVGVDERLPRILPWTLCCARNRSQPGYEAIKADGVHVVLHGQRSADFPKRAAAPLEYPGLELVAPLWDVSRESVWSAVRELNIELPDHYGQYPSSLDCSVCPSSLTTQRRAWMAGRYPEHLAVAEKLHADVAQAVIAALDGDNTKNAFSPK